jgi:hypothetical protein
MGTGPARQVRAVIMASAPALGFSDKANLDDGAMWTTTYALTELTAADEAAIGALVKAVSGAED